METWQLKDQYIVKSVKYCIGEKMTKCTCGGEIRCHSDPNGEDEGRPWACDDCGRDVS